MQHIKRCQRANTEGYAEREKTKNETLVAVALEVAEVNFKPCEEHDVE